LRMVIDISGGTFVGIVGKEHEGSGRVGACNCACIHLSKHHAGGFDQSDGCVYGEEFTGG
jgi:hypothetical protein